MESHTLPCERSQLTHLNMATEYKLQMKVAHVMKDTWLKKEEDA